MTSYAEAFLVQDNQKLAISRNLGDALSVIVKTIWPTNTAKQIEKACSVDRVTAKNVVGGVAGGAVVTKIVRARQASADDHWDLWIELGRQIFGEDLSEYEERKLQHLIEVTEHAKENLVFLRARRLALVQKARAGDALALGLAAEPDRGAAFRGGHCADGAGAADDRQEIGFRDGRGVRP